MKKERESEIKQKMSLIADLIEQGNDPSEISVDTVNYYNNFVFKGKDLGETFVARVQNLKQNNTTYELYSEQTGSLIATVDSQGKLHFTQEYIENLREIDAKYLEKLELEDLDFELPKELQKDDKILTKKERELTKAEKVKGKNQEEKDKQEDKEEEEQEEKKPEKDEDTELQEEIAEKKGVPPHNVMFIKENSNFYKDHPELESNLYFYRDSNGVVKAEYIDQDGKSQPSKFFEDSQTSLRQETVSIGDDGNPVTKEVPYQVMKTKGLNTVDKDIKDIRININIDTYGYLDIEESRQGKSGEWLSHDIELKGRSYNSKAVNDSTSIRNRNADPDKQLEAYKKAEQNEYASEDGIQYDEIYLVQHAGEIVDELINEGYQKPEAVDILNYMLGEENLSLDEAKAREDEAIANREQEEPTIDSETPEREEVDDDELQRTPGGDAYNRRFGG